MEVGLESGAVGEDFGVGLAGKAGYRKTVLLLSVNRVSVVTNERAGRLAILALALPSKVSFQSWT